MSLAGTALAWDLPERGMVRMSLPAVPVLTPRSTRDLELVRSEGGMVGPAVSWWTWSATMGLFTSNMWSKNVLKLPRVRVVMLEWPALCVQFMYDAMARRSSY